MRTILLIAALAATPTLAAEPACLNTPHYADATTGQAQLRRLDTLPPAAEILTVIRKEQGCQKPVVVRYGIGGRPHEASHRE